MLCLVVLPSFICGLALCLNDMLSRTVPRLWIYSAMVMQYTVIVLIATDSNRCSLLFIPLLFAICAGFLQLLLALLKPGALGFGDVTSTAMFGLSVGVAGFRAFLMWWLLMGVLGLLWIWIWPTLHKLGGNSNTSSIPFVPPIFCAAVIAVVSAQLAF